jgi:hypothetical protein
MTQDERHHWIHAELKPMWEADYLDNERQLRNLLAHPTGRFITSPIEAARALSSLSSVISALWSPAKS